jgi:membrane protein YqaA with SNARE-associated domain
VGNASAAYGRAGRRRTTREYVLGGLSVVLTIVLCVLVIVYWQEFVQFSKYGYIGVFIVSFLAGITVLVPVPSVFIVFTLGAVLNPVLVGLIAGAGETTGSMGVYLTGLSSARAFHALDHTVMAKFRAWIKSRGALSVFAMSAIFNPLFYPFTAIAGMMHFGWWRFFILCLAGKSLKNILVAAAGYYGFKLIVDLLGGRIPL